MRSDREKLVDWIVMLDSEDFKGTDAELVRNEMLDCIGLNLLKKSKDEKKNKYCGKLIYEDDIIKCGEWSGGDQHFCKECFYNNEN